uniref:WD domain-containing protein, G-beta repeat-containing protein n=1 Tax=Candidatus Kentrum sp. FW TaxID=2126338 RepID=A0A450TTJ0_9GAMM|nr:MAG: WD domain-containing protein, G-beta repeat-containing protein [Candidatus Kentron sp. FW]
MTPRTIRRRLWCRLCRATIPILAIAMSIGSLFARDAIADNRGIVRLSDGQEAFRYGKSYALLVGVSDYDRRSGWNDLGAIPGELDRVETALKSAGFHKIVRVKNPNDDQLHAAFEGFKDDYGFEENNRLLFFFSGHGYTDKDGAGYLVPADAPNPRKDRQGFLKKALSMSRIMSWAREIKARHALFLFDSCFSGSVFRERSLPKTPPHITRLTKRRVRQFITAGSANEPVPAESTFAPAFSDAIAHGEGDLNGDGYVTGMELGVHLEAEVSRYTQQTPQFGKIDEYKLAQGDFVFVLASRGGVGAVVERGKPPVVQRNESPASGNTTLDLEFWNGIKQSQDPDLYRAYLKQFPNGTFAAIARKRIEKFTARETQTAAERVGVRDSGLTQTYESSRVGVRPEGLTPTYQPPVGWGEPPRGEPQQGPQQRPQRAPQQMSQRAPQQTPRHPPQPAPARLVVRSNVAGDTVTINGQEVGPTGPDAHVLAPGEYKIRVEKPGFEPFEKTIQLAAGDRETVRARLVSAPRLRSGTEVGVRPPSVPPPRSETGVEARLPSGVEARLPSAPRLRSGTGVEAYANWRVLRKIKAHSGGICVDDCLAFSPDGRRLLTGSYDDTLKLWDVASGKAIRTFRGHSYDVKAVAFSPDGRRALSGSKDNTLKLWNLATGKTIRTFQGHSSYIVSVAFSPDGGWALSGSSDNTLKLWDVASGQALRTFEGHTNWVRSVVFSPDGGWALSGSKDNTVKLWDVASGQALRTFRGHSGDVTSVAFSPDGRRALSGSYDDTVKLWDVASGNPIRTFRGHSDNVLSVAFSPDGRVALSGSGDKTVKIWDLASGARNNAPIRTLTGHEDRVYSVAFSPDGRRAASGDYGGVVILWGAE